jgi:hypothetical protein
MKLTFGTQLTGVACRCRQAKGVRFNVICVLLSLAFSPPLKKFSSSLLLIQKMPATQKPVLHTLPLYCIYYPYTAALCNGQAFKLNRVLDGSH